MSWQSIPMRRKARAMTQEECLKALRRGEWGVLGLAAPASFCEVELGEADGPLPYAVPLNYAVREAGDGLVFHGALQGLKMRMLDANPRACFTVVPSAQTDPEHLTTHYESVMVYGRMRRLEDAERKEALLLLGHRFSKNFPQQMVETLHQYDSKTAVFCLDIQGMNGKYNRGKG